MASKIHIQTRINGEEVDFLCETRQSLLEVLREDLGLTGTKEGCSNGNCGGGRSGPCPRGLPLCPAFSMRAHIDGDDLVRREPGLRAH